MRGRKPTAKPTESGLLVRPPKAPVWLSPESKAVWKRAAKLLVERRVLAQSDLDTLESYCVASGNVQIISAGRGNKDQHGTLNQAQAIQIKLAAELGLSPVSRQRVGTEPSEQTDNDFQDLGL